MNPTAQAVDQAFYVIGAITIFFLLFITALMVFFALKYHHRRHPKAEQIAGNTTLEIIWTLVPTLLVLVMFWYGYKGFLVLRKVPKDALQIEVTARMWKWSFTYPNGKKTDVLYVPKGRPIKLNLKSVDVIHSFYIPAFRIKEDALPGQTNYLWFKPEALGPADIFCAEFCGVKHAFMLSRVEVMTPEAFKKWYEGDRKPSQAEVHGGFTLLKEQGCLTCHSLDGTEELAPTFKGLFGKKRTVTQAGKEKIVTADEAYLREAILQPSHSIVKGFDDIMPPLDLSSEEVDKIIAFLKTNP